MPVEYDSDFSDTNSSVYLSARVNVNTTGVEAKVGATSDPGRQFVYIKNLSDETVYYGPSGLAVSDMGYLEEGDEICIAASSGISVILKTSSGTSDVIVQEIG